ncbi:shikimate kinase [Roseicitreum antarcticum]|uniref:Shikimate kinase n=1 Tax=Roseicitreum antarcticum TaxID=564137 RepID=A0A1H3BHZ1_9RHOB|nr:shikimate kinase [Roseicitreum antarcticum]
MTEILHKTVVLVGMMGAGKTAIGTELARLLGVPFVDSDDEIVRAANMSIPEIFARDGEAFFRLKEAQVIARLLSGPPGILSVGGGAFLSAETRTRITGLGISVWLRADLELLWTRVRQKTSRPLLRTANPRQTLGELLAERDPIYALADLTVDARAEYSIAEMAGQVCAALLSRPDVVQSAPYAGGTDGSAPAGTAGRAGSGAAKAQPPPRGEPDRPQTPSAGNERAAPRNTTAGAPARRNGGAK